MNAKKPTPSSSIDQVRNMCRTIEGHLSAWEDARARSFQLFQSLANASIATGYVKSRNGWQDGEESLHRRLEIKLWHQRKQAYQDIKDQLLVMSTAVEGLRDPLASLREQKANSGKDQASSSSSSSSSPPPPLLEGFCFINAAYLVELLTEAIESLEQEGQMCQGIFEAAVSRTGAHPAAAVEDREKQLLYTSTWSIKPLVHEQRARALKEVLRIELGS